MALALLVFLGSASPCPRGVCADEGASSSPAAPRLVIQGGHTKDVRSAQFSHSGTHVLTASLDKSVLIWEADTGREIRRIPVLGGLVLAGTLSPDDRYVLIGSSIGALQVIDAVTGELIQDVTAHSEAISALVGVQTPAGLRAITASADHTARVWDPLTGELLVELGGKAPPHAHSDRIQALAVRPGGAYVLTCGRDGAAILWKIATGEPMRLFRRASAPAEGVTAAAFESDGAHVLIGYADGLVVRYDMQQRIVSTIQAHERSVLSLSLSPDNRVVLTGSTDATAHMFDLGTGKPLGDPLQHPRGVTCTGFSPDGSQMLTVSGSTTHIWETASASERTRLEGQTRPVRAVSVSKDGYRMATASSGGTAHVWDLTTGSVVRSIAGHGSAISSLAISADGARLVTGSEDTTVRVWNLRTGDQICELTGHAGGAHAVALAGDGTLLATGGGDKQARVCTSTPADRALATITGHTGQVVSVALSSDGSKLATGSDDTTLRLWDVHTGEQLWVVSDFKSSVSTVAFAPDDSRLLAGSHDGTVRLLDGEAGRTLQALESRGVAVHTLAFSADGTVALTGTEDGQARLWALGPAAQGGPELVLRGAEARVTAVAFSPDGHFLLAGSEDQVVRLYERATGALRATLISFEHGGWAVVDPDGRFDASEAGDVVGMHWVMTRSTWPGAESISLAEFKERFYEPGLLAKILGYDDGSVRSVSPLAMSELAPRVDVRNDRGLLHITVTNRGAGIGRVVVMVNGKERSADLRPPGTDPNQATLSLVEDLREDPRFVSGESNNVEVFAYNAAGDLHGRGVEVKRPPRGAREETSLWAVVVGVSKYAGRKLELKYAAKDAADFAAALTAGSEELFGKSRTHVTLLTDARREDVLSALEGAKAARAGDVFVLFLAGHGIVHQDSFFYLTAQAESDDLSKAGTADTAAISSSLLVEAMNAIPANKQVMILDTCASGRFIEQLTGRRGTSSSQRRALDRVKDRTGTFVLAGCAADLVSYEHPRYGQGLLTYSLLLGMRGGQLRENKYVDVASLFGFAEDRVPEFARAVGGSQNPIRATPAGSSSFDIGLLTAQAQQRIVLRQPLPYFTKTSLQDRDEGSDLLGMGARIDQALTDLSGQAKQESTFYYISTDALDDAYRIAGTYWVTEKGANVHLRLWRGQSEPFTQWIDIEAAIDELPALVAAAVLERLPPR